MQIGGEATGRRGLCFFFSFQYLVIFANKTGSKIKKHVGVSTRGGVLPIGGGYDPNPNVFLILLVMSRLTFLCRHDSTNGPYFTTMAIATLSV